MHDGKDEHAGEGDFGLTEAGADECGAFFHFAEAVDEYEDCDDDECDHADEDELGDIHA